MADPYSEKALHFFNQYQKLAFEDVHQHWLAQLPESPGSALDVGAGSGRDAAALASRGWHVLAAEPATALRQLGENAARHLAVEWCEDHLPELSHVRTLDHRFDLILVSAVWMHLPPSQRNTAFQVLTDLLSPGGILVITLRHGPGDGERVFYETNRDELERLAESQSLASLPVAEGKETDRMGRSEVAWETAVFQNP
ncbi:hypothetical protein CK501_15880 [Halovibrio salipaludis]|uniref:Methyltransferase domain-containing protein n=1 Tax=Halovibrio salipaludis TaxID=2032626 RepID=A0A2A2EVB5_9GAMM|nr:class I SAM-dependent methyltransferase [Halovibrio salipaludis]PAU76414.1 hypothetical protein CK501_15880 [Halovibrio salipaludis]